MVDRSFDETNVYHGGFDFWEDVQSRFRIPAVPKPDEVIFAEYDAEDYFGSAFVIYRNGDDYFTVYGSHCSCYGLEDQWDPEKYTLEQLLAAAEKGEDWGVMGRGYAHVKAHLAQPSLPGLDAH